MVLIGGVNVILKTIYKNLFFSYKYLKTKKKEGVIADIYVPEWRALLTDRDIGNYRIEIDLGNGHRAGVMVVDIDKPGSRAEGVYLNLEYIDDEKYIHECSLTEFITIYLSTFRYLVENNYTLDILEIKERIENGKNYN